MPKPVDILAPLRDRFDQYPGRHEGILWSEIEPRLQDPKIIATLAQMEATGGEPDCIGRNELTGELLIVDCSPESPKGRRSLCFDHESRITRKDAPPASSAGELAQEIGIDLLDESLYFRLQDLGEFDLKTSSWLATPGDFRAKGGALFGDRRFGRTFIYHNGAQSYYAARGFRGVLRV
jgi:hypothetical protein